MKKIFAIFLSVLMILTVFSGCKANTNQPIPDNGDTNKSQTIRITLDEWIGWKSLIDANGGLKTAPNSIYDKLGLDVEFMVVNDAASSSKMLMKGEIQGAGYTVNRFAFLEPQFKDANCEVTMAYITNYSNGGDGVIATNEIKTMKDLVGKKIAVPEFSEAQTLIEYLIRNSELTTEQKEQIHKDMVLVQSSDEAGEMFMAGKVDAAATWEPYLTLSKEENGHVFLSTADNTNLILDGIVFSNEFLKNNAEEVTKLIKGAIEASDMYTTEFKYIREMPLFADMSENDIINMASGAKLTTIEENIELLGQDGGAREMYKEMANIWISLGENANPEVANEVFSSAYAEALR